MTPLGITGNAPYDDRGALPFDFEGHHNVDIFGGKYHLGRRRYQQLQQ